MVVAGVREGSILDFRFWENEIAAWPIFQLIVVLILQFAPNLIFGEMLHQTNHFDFWNARTYYTDCATFFKDSTLRL